MKQPGPHTIAELRHWAISAAFSGQADVRTAAAAIERIGFVQADPIRAPARAQDLILRQRVASGAYRAGDLERLYPDLDVEEDYLYAYGFLARRAWRWAHPKPTVRLSRLEQRVRDAVIEAGEMHPGRLEEHLGQSFRAVNAWGGLSKASTRALDHLHFHGVLRIKRRERGVRVYAPALPYGAPVPAAERLRQLLQLAVRIFAPVPEPGLRQILRLLTYCHVQPPQARECLAKLLEDGVLVKRSIDGLAYLWPADFTPGPAPADRHRVRILAPFDPLVWDRARFEHLWKWPYRFEAYTPPSKRKLGYYAMPLLWQEQVIGWVNAPVSGGQLAWSAGYVSGEAPRSRSYRDALQEELQLLAEFLGCALPG